VDQEEYGNLNEDISRSNAEITVSPIGSRSVSANADDKERPENSSGSLYVIDNASFDADHQESAENVDHSQLLPGQNEPLDFGEGGFGGEVDFFEMDDGHSPERPRNLEIQPELLG
jgi:hypothetical protein